MSEHTSCAKTAFFLAFRECARVACVPMGPELVQTAKPMSASLVIYNRSQARRLRLLWVVVLLALSPRVALADPVAREADNPDLVELVVVVNLSLEDLGKYKKRLVDNIERSFLYDKRGEGLANKLCWITLDWKQDAKMPLCNIKQNKDYNYNEMIQKLTTIQERKESALNDIESLRSQLQVLSSARLLKLYFDESGLVSAELLWPDSDSAKGGIKRSQCDIKKNCLIANENSSCEDQKSLSSCLPGTLSLANTSTSPMTIKYKITEENQYDGYMLNSKLSGKIKISTGTTVDLPEGHYKVSSYPHLLSTSYNIEIITIRSGETKSISVKYDFSRTRFLSRLTLIAGGMSMLAGLWTFVWPLAQRATSSPSCDSPAGIPVTYQCGGMSRYYIDYEYGYKVGGGLLGAGAVISGVSLLILADPR